jgi:hypothetical protein
VDYERLAVWAANLEAVMKLFGVAFVVAALAHGGSAANAETSGVSSQARSHAASNATDVSARRVHRRNRIHPTYARYPVYPTYYARPTYYRPYPYSVPVPFFLGFGYLPYE